ncbi:MAG: DUF302 domain-containing protein, partial [Terracidiphilus sp.]
VVVTVVSGWTCARLLKQLRRGPSTFHRSPTVAIAVTAALSAVGTAILIGPTLLAQRQPSHPATAEIGTMDITADNGIVAVRSHQSVDQTVEKLKAILQAKGTKVFAVIDHSGEATAAGLSMRPTKLLLFCNPKAGTPLMQASPSVAIDLPLKLLVSEDAEGRVWISYNAPAYLQARHHLPENLLQPLAAVAGLAKAAGE